MNKDKYDPDWADGEWFTNCKGTDYVDLYVRGILVPSYPGDKNGFKSEKAGPLNRMGPPKGTDSIGVEALVSYGSVGVYRLPEVSSERSREQEMARLIRLGTYSGLNWVLEYDERRAREYVTEEYVAVMTAIAGFIEGGRTKGISPFWKLHLNG